jgi:putative transposase
MIRTFRYPLLPTKAQEATLDAWRLKCCELYNAALEQRREAWRKQRVSPSLYDQHKQLTELRQSDPAWSDMPAWVQRSALTRLDRAFKAFFRRVKSGGTPGFPRFRSRDRYDSFSVPCGDGISRLASNSVVLPKIGAVRLHKYRELRGTPLDVRVHRGARCWHVSFVCDLGEAPVKLPVRNAVGVDVGLTAFATLSNGEAIGNPRFYREGQAALTRRSQSLARKRRGSNSRKRAKSLVARAHEHVRNQRLDFARKFACALFSRFDMVAHEDLSISRMVHGHLAKSIHDAAWGVFLQCLSLKAENAGRHVIAVDPRGTSQRCSRCGEVCPKTLSDREHRCRCGLTLGRDHNAARNVLALGLSAEKLTEASWVHREPLEAKPERAFR